MKQTVEKECEMCDSVIEFDRTTRLYLQHFCSKGCAEKYIARELDEKLPWRHKVRLNVLEDYLQEMGFEKEFS